MGRWDSGAKSGIRGGVPRGRGMLVDILARQVYVRYRTRMRRCHAPGLMVAVFRWPVRYKGLGTCTIKAMDGELLSQPTMQHVTLCIDG